MSAVVYSIVLAVILSLIFTVISHPSRIGSILRLFSSKTPLDLNAGFHLVNQGDKDGQFDIDIIAVHGLNADSRYTWTASTRGDPKAVKINWLDKFLRTDFPKARIWVCNYYSSYFTNATTDSAFEIGKKLLDQIVEQRERDRALAVGKQHEFSRPIFFIGHSFGGIVIHKALATAADRNSDPKYADIRKSTAGVIYLGTPFNGSSISFLAALLCNALYRFGPDGRLLQTLSPNSDELRELRERFKAIYLENKYFHHFCFYEALPSSYLGLKTMIVDRDSAVLDALLSESLDTDHSGLNKFSSRKDPSYVRIRQKLQEIIDQNLRDGIEPSIFEIAELAFVNILSDKSRRKAVLLSRFFRPPSRPSSKYIERSHDGVPMLQTLSDSLEHWSQTKRFPSVAILLGTGGSGKTQLALKYCETTRQEQIVPNIFWVDASSSFSIVHHFENAARQIDDNYHRQLVDKNFSGLTSPDHGDSVQQAVDIVTKYLEMHDPWIIVFDSYDQPDEAKPIEAYFPKATPGEILITSRNRSTERHGRVIEVGRMSEGESMSLLTKDLPDDLPIRTDPIYDIKKVVDKLGYLPLALAQARGTFFHQRWSARKFLKRFEEKRKSVFEELEQWEYLRLDDRELAANVFTTWELSVDSVSGNETLRAQKLHFLEVAGFLHPTRIDGHLFRKDIEKSTELQPWNNLFLNNGIWHDFLFERVTAELQNLSLLERIEDDDEESRLFNIHPLVSDWIKLRLAATIQWDRILEAGWVIRHSMPDDIFSNNEGIRETRIFSLATHASTVTRNAWKYLRPRGAIFRQAPPFGRDFASFLRYFHLWQTSKNIYTSILNERRSVKEWDGEDIECAYELCGVYSHDGNLHSALDLARKSLPRATAILGAENASVLKFQARLGVILHELGLWKEAGQVLHRIYEDFKRTRGEQSFLTLECRANLAGLYISECRFGDAQSHYLEILELLKAAPVCGPDHDYTLQTERVLVNIFFQSHQLDAALKLGDDTLKKHQMRYGFSHPDTILIQLLIASAHKRHGNLREAIEIIRCCREHSSNLSGIPLAVVYLKLGALVYPLKPEGLGDLQRSKEDLSVAVRAFHESGDYLSKHSILASSLLAGCYKREGDFETAKKAIEIVLREYEKSGLNDYNIENSIYWNLYYVVVPGTFPKDQSIKPEVLYWLKRGLHATYQLGRWDSESIRHAGSGITGCILAREPDLQDYASWLLLFAWEKQARYQLAQQSFEWDSDEYQRAINTALPSLISTLCDSLIRQRKSYDIRSLGIAAACLHHKDVENARVAYEKILQNRHPYVIVKCDLCGRSQPLAGSFYFCQICPDITLHPACYSRYRMEHLVVREEETALPGGCNNHEYQEVNRDDWEDDSKYEVINRGSDRTSLVEWLTEMKIKYGDKKLPSRSIELITFLADLLVDSAPY